ncbi:hypothetical protein J2Z42_001646 [Clostridium algifaecis]|uniref:Uncharacterized protein n=1 Tax=Clostridium algifaecis TaxID=1472040 RepID=A0ABS4KSG5_9CLOT|nr:hypothetical protein [Clostridium algifaecis]
MSIEFLLPYPSGAPAPLKCVGITFGSALKCFIVF